MEKKMIKTILLSFLAGGILFGQSFSSKISQKVYNSLNANNGNEKILVWIFLTDKGNAIQQYFNEPTKVVSEKSLKRREKVFSKTSLINEADIPVNQEYINQLTLNGFELKQKSKWFNSISGFVSPNKLNLIASLPFVKSIDVVEKYTKNYETPIDYNAPINEPPVFLKPNETFLYDYGNSLSQLQQINVPAVHNLGYTGQGVTICVMDAGFNRLTHESFATMDIIAKWDFVNNDPDVGDGTGQGSGSHGTQTLSTIGGFKQTKLIGPAFGASYILAKTENTESETPIEEDNWIAALEWADSIGVDVTSTSLGYITFDPPYQSYTWMSMDGNTCRITIAADLAVARGIVVVNSAGNEGYHATHNTLGAPADGDSVIAVGAVTSTGTRSSFSSVGNTVDGRIKPDIMARGSSVTVASSSNNTLYTTSSGTSFSCPLAAGVAALILCVSPTLTPMQVRDAMRNTASKNQNPDREYGWGILNALDAINYFSVPVELISFTAQNDGSGIILKWTTATELNNKGFDIEKSKDLNNWRTIGFIEGNGSTTEKNNYQFIDYEKDGGIRYYRLKQIDFNGNYTYSFIVMVDELIPNELILEQNYPNPFNPSTTIKYSIPEDAFVQLNVYDILGEEVANLVNQMQNAGTYSVEFSTSKIENGKDLHSGVYFYELKAGKQIITKKFILMK